MISKDLLSVIIIHQSFIKFNLTLRDGFHRRRQSILIHTSDLESTSFVFLNIEKKNGKYVNYI